MSPSSRWILNRRRAHDVVSDWLDSVGVGTQCARTHRLFLEQLRAQGIRDEQVPMRLPQCRASRNLLMKRLNIRPRKYRAFADRPYRDDFAAPYGGANDGITELTPQIRCWNWHWFRLSDGDSGASGTSRLPVERIKGLQWQGAAA